MESLQHLSTLLIVSEFFRTLNPLDAVIVVIFIFYAWEGFEVGFTTAFVDFISFILSFVVGLKTYSVLGGVFLGSLGIPHGFANAIGFFLTAVVTEIIINILLRKLHSKLGRVLSLKQEEFAASHTMVAAYLQSFHRFLGVLPAVASAFVLLSFLLTLVITLPFSPFLKKTVSSSLFGNMLTAASQGFERRLSDIFGQAAQETLNVLTVEPKSETAVKLGFTTTGVSVDEQAESQMLVLLNKERASKGLRPVIADPTLREIARSHAKDMLARGYFSHYTPEGLSPFDRMANGNIRYAAAGENLALAPSVALAMQGFMNSPAHRANILSSEFGKVGIGTIDAGIYGEMFAQEFTD